MSTIFRQYTPEECDTRDGYPPQWHTTIKHAVREQAGNRCVRCLHPYERGAGEWSRCDAQCAHRGPLRLLSPDDAREIENRVDYSDPREPAAGEWVQWGAVVDAQWRILTVHHLDGDKGNCRWWNLTALCQRCHLLIQGKVRMSRRWQHEHTPWFRPYVAGYYASTFLGEELSRAEVEARLDELLDLEDRQLSLSEAEPRQEAA